MDAFGWGVVGAVAAVVGVVVAIVFGIIPLLPGRRKAKVLPAEGASDAEVVITEGLGVVLDRRRSVTAGTRGALPW